MRKVQLLLACLVFSVAAFAADKVIKLPKPNLNRTGTVMKALSERHSTREFASKALNLSDLSDLLWAANGINRSDSGKRTAPSALNKQDVDVYVVLPEGSYLYDAKNHQLNLIAEGDYRGAVAGGQAFVISAPVSLVLVSDLSRFGDTKNAHTQLMGAMDAGIVSQNISIFCSAARLATVPRASIDINQLKKVKKGINQGWFGNASAAVGTEDRYGSNLMLNRFVDNSQFSLIGSANNVNDQGFSGGGGPRFRNSNGLTATKMLGANFATQSEKLELGGSARYNFSDRDALSTNYSERFLQNGNSYSNSNSKNRNKNTNFNADFRLEWKPDTLTNIIFRPNFSYGKSDSHSKSESGTFKSDPFNLVPNPNDFLDKSIWNTTDDPLDDIRVNASNSESSTESNSLSANASLQVNRRLNNQGRNITFRGTFSYGDNDSEQFSESLTRYFDTAVGKSDDERKQYITSPTQNYDYTAELTYNEPVAKATFLQFRYKFQYKYSESDRSTYSLLPDADKGQDWIWNYGDGLPEGYESNKDMSLSKYAQYKYYNHDINAGLNIIREKYRLNFGVSLQPQNTRLDYKKAEIDTVVKRNVFNFAPNIDFRYRFSKVSQLRFTYRGRASQPSMENLLDVTDDSNPLNIRMGNPGLKPSFSHSMRLFYNTYNGDKQRGMMAHAFLNMTQNSITNSTTYNQATGGVTVKPENINGNWNAMGMFGFNTALKDKRFTINSFSRVNYTNAVAYLYNESTQVNDKNTSTTLTLGENLNGTFRNDWFEFTINGSINYNFERNELRPENNQEPYTFGYGASTNISLPWSMTLSTNITNNARRGYRDTSMNKNELIWNAQIAQNFLKGNAATISLEIYDILRQQSNISRSLTADMRSVSEYNGINSYCMLRFSYRLNVFGNKEARGNMRQGGFDGGGHRGPRGPHGGGPGRMMRF